MRRRSITALAALLTTLVTAGACSRTSDNYATAAEIPADEARAAAAIDRAAAQNGARLTALEGLPVSPPPIGPARNRVLPTAFQGYWGVTPNDCELANTEAHGRLNIDADTIRQWEGKGSVDRIVAATPYRAVADISFSDAGTRWKTRTTLTLGSGGMTMMRSDAGGRPLQARYQKC